jgi:uncharacterized membrane protein
MSWIADIGRMVGLGSLAGFRPSLTFAIMAVMVNLGWGASVNSSFSFIHHWLTVVVFVVLALFESAFDKVPTVDRMQDRLTAPYRIVVGAVVAAATVGHGWKGILVGAVVGALCALFALRSKQETRPRSTPSDVITPLRSLIEDIFVFAGTALTLMQAWVGYLVFAVAILIHVRVQLRRRRKYSRFRARQT